ncbi:MAG: hypothetical protein GY835_07530 [bacterium]|nr:hypothetical protein [bacterium]
MSAVKTYAPLLLYHSDEKHFPGAPEQFRQNARFRQSNFSGRRDRGWNRTQGRWENNNKSGSDYRGAEWDVIRDQIDLLTRERRPEGPTRDGDVTRPRDDRNLWSAEDKTRGFFLELKSGFGKAGSGCNPSDPVPVFHDIDKFSINGRRYVAVLYWFFYIQNWFVIYTHEGDWEHITLYFREEDFEAGDEPIWIYFASHNSGHYFRWTDKRLRFEEDSHPSVYVSRFGHPSTPTVLRKRRQEYIYRIRTWDREIPSILDFDWATYCGAWGEVGEKAMTTGPLGPLFKRNQDIQMVKRII